MYICMNVNMKVDLQMLYSKLDRKIIYTDLMLRLYHVCDIYDRLFCLTRLYIGLRPIQPSRYHFVLYFLEDRKSLL